MMCVLQRIRVIIAKPNTAPILYIEIRNNNFCQTATAIERMRADAGHTVRDGYRGQSAAARERIRADAGHSIRNDKFRYLRILITIKMMCIVQWIGKIITKLNIAPILYIWNDNLFQATTVTECIRADGGHAVWDGHRGQTATVIERRFANAGHAIGDDY